MTRNVLIYAARSDTRHKLDENLSPGEQAFWSVHGTPRQPEPGCRVYFHDGERIYVKGTIAALESGRIWFKGLTSVSLDHPDRPDGGHRGFRYIDDLPTGDSR